MKTQELVNSGNFATGDGKKGNFNAYGNDGRFFIHKQLMETLGWKEQKDVKFPFFAITEERELELVDAEGNKTGEKSSRRQATAIFTSEEQMLQAFTAADRFKVKAESIVADERLNSKVSLANKATAAGLTKEQIGSLLAASI